MPPALPYTLSQMNPAGGRPSTARRLITSTASPAYRPASAPRYLPRKLFGDSTVCTQSGRVVSALGLSAVDVDTASVAYVHPWYASRTATTSRRPVAAVARR